MWYKARALTESIKTTCWRYMMRADPYPDATNLEDSKAEFQNTLMLIFESNKSVLGSFPKRNKSKVTRSMDEIRQMIEPDRVEFYKTFRIKEQLDWYSSKSRSNTRSSRIWRVATVFIYLLAIASVLLRIIISEVPHSPTEMLIVLASSILAWSEVKRYNELSSSFALTAHEILLQSRANKTIADVGFSEFTNEAELAFSREHTQWVARLQEKAY